MSNVDDAPVRFERVDYNTTGAIMVSIIVKGTQFRHAISVRDDSSPEEIAQGFHSLANWIERKIADAGLPGEQQKEVAHG